MKMSHRLKIAFFGISLLLFFTTPCHAYDVTMAWDKNGEPDLAGYKLYYNTGISGPPYHGTGATEGNSPITIGIGNPDDPKDPDFTLRDPDNPQFTLRGLSDNEIYYFVVTAYDIENLESVYSNEVSNDEDVDGMADNWEIAYFGDLSHDGTGDSEPDGLTDLDEFQNKTDPTNPDSDGDGFTDGEEVTAGTDPNDPQSHPSKAMPWIPLLLLDD